MNKFKPAEYYKHWRLRNKGRRIWELWYAAKCRAKVRNVPFTLKREDIVIPKRCPVLGIKIAHQTGKRQSDNSPSIDRIIPSRGYTKRNVVVVSFRANRIKNDSTMREMRRIVEFYEKLL